MKSKPKLKIGLVLDESLDPPDGVQQYVLRVGEWLSAQGHSVYYLVGETKRRDQQYIYSLTRNIKVAYNGNRLSIPLPVLTSKIQQLLNELQLDIIHVQAPYSPFLAGKIIRCASVTTAVVGTFHILPYNRLAIAGSKLLAAINHRTARRFDAMMAVSEPAAEFARQVFGLTSTVVPNPFDFQKFHNDKKARVPTGTTDIVFLGRLVERKGGLLLLKAINAIVQKHLTEVPFRVTIAGKGPDNDKMQAFIGRNNLGAVVTMPGFIAEEDKPTLLASADVAVFPSISGESFGISLLEAMAAARGVVLAGNNPGYAAVMENKEQLIQPQDVTQFSQTVAEWLNHPAARAQAAARQKEYVQQFDIAEVGPQILAIYSKALQTRRPS